jgi:hypothetical protein
MDRQTDMPKLTKKLLTLFLSTRQNILHIYLNFSFLSFLAITEVNSFLLDLLNKIILYFRISMDRMLLCTGFGTQSHVT